VYYYDYERIEGGILLACMDHQNGLDFTYRLTALTVEISIFALVFTYFLVRVVSADMIRPLAENSRRQREFITNASHELKTPLAVIRSNTEMTEVISGETEWTRSTMKQVERLGGLVQNLILIARSQEQEQSRKTADLDISQVVRETAESFTSVAASSEKDYSLDIADNVHLTADSSSIQMLCSVLIDNAIKYCDDEGTIEIYLSQKKPYKPVTFSISNTYAEGKDVDYSKFFERFFRQDESHTIEGKGGYGIGLSVAESICRKNGGDINATWKDGVITFSCLLKGERK
jgi:signal transduction histidine kinase